MQRAQNWADCFSKWQSLQLYKLGITPPRQRIPISTRANLALGRIYRGMPIPWLGPDRPLMPDSIPSRRNGGPHGANPNAENDRVPGCVHQASLESGRHLRTANA